MMGIAVVAEVVGSVNWWVVETIANQPLTSQGSLSMRRHALGAATGELEMSSAY